MTTWNGSTKPRTQDHMADRYTLTVAGFVATLPRGACGHLLCHGRDRCAWGTSGTQRGAEAIHRAFVTGGGE